MQKKIILYVSLIFAAILLFILAMTVGGNTSMIAPIMITLGICLFWGSIVKLCQMNDTLKNTLLCAIDILLGIP